MQARKVVDAAVRNHQISHLFDTARDHFGLAAEGRAMSG
jgi:hypothetical protein